MIAEPPLLAGAFHERAICPGVDVAETAEAKVPGNAAATTGALLVEGRPAPIALTAETLNE